MTDNRTIELEQSKYKPPYDARPMRMLRHHIECDCLATRRNVLREIEDLFAIELKKRDERIAELEQAIAATLGSDTKGCENLLWELVGALDVADATDASKKPIVTEYARRIVATLRSVPDDAELTQTYNAEFGNGVMAVFQQLEGIEDYEELQCFIAEYWGEGEGNDER